MAPYIQPGVEEVSDAPESGATVDLVLVPEQGAADAVRDGVETLGDRVVIDREIEFGMLAVTADQVVVEDLCDLPGLQSITFEEELAVLDSGNSKRPRRTR